jgi:crotonobetainyl-CoA:carnitine CoA-transferase CaiB-like acyl-CoA transferase
MAELIATADVFLENMRPHVVSGLGFGSSELLRQHPRLVICSVNAFGAVGDRARDPGYDPIVQALTGMMFANGFEGDPPIRSGASVVDKSAALWATIKILAALMRREATGLGSHVSVSLLAAGAHLMGADILRFLTSGEESIRLGSSGGGGGPHGAFETADLRWIQIAVGNDAMYRRLCEVAEHPELAADARFATMSLRGRYRTDLNALLVRVFRERDAARWQVLLRSAGVPNAPVNRIADYVADESLSGPFLSTATRSRGPDVVQVLSPLEDHGAPPRRLPRLGEDTEAVLRDVLGWTPAQIRAGDDLAPGWRGEKAG